jgi:diguanylate cyclase (GGDEF)-like protein/PAS domain S-box-containing protein
MDRERRSNSEVVLLWERLENLKRRDSNLALVSEAVPNVRPNSIKAEIEGRLGFFPPYFAPAEEVPPLLESLWHQQRTSYYDNPLPNFFKENLLLRLSRYCISPYFIVTHACTLRELGMAAQDVLQLIEKTRPTSDDIEQAHKALSELPHPVQDWLDEPAFEHNLLTLSVAAFLGLTEWDRCTAKLKEILEPVHYLSLISLLSYAKSSHLWLEAHPEVSCESLPVVRKNFMALVQDEPQLVQIFQNHKELVTQLPERTGQKSDSGENEDHYREMFENASDIIYLHDFEGKLLSVNRVIERVTGYTQSEALQMKITDIILPEYASLGQKLIDPQIAGEVPLHYEVDIFSKDKTRISLDISTRPIFRSGKPVAVQGIARDITKRKQTEVALQESNQKLEAWVDELQQRTREMTLLNEMGDILRACFTTEEAYSVIVRVAQQIFPAKVGALYVIGTSRNVVESAAVWGDPELAENSFSPPECWALRRGRTHWVENAHSGMICKHVHHPSPDGYMCIPMMAQSEALGVLHLMQPDNIKMTESKQRLAITMSEHIAMALSNLRLHETLRSQSIRDPLTGLFNRRFMEESLELEIRRAARNQRPLGMIMIDLDHFKYFNDNFGHEAGDLLLKELGTLLRTNIRGEDIACRYGGEEFTLILPEGTSAVTRQRADFYKDAIQRLDVHFRGMPLGRITASMGVAVFPDHGRTAQALIEAADKALYRSKAAGRDRVSMAT